MLRRGLDGKGYGLRIPYFEHDSLYTFATKTGENIYRPHYRKKEAYKLFCRH